MRARVCVHACVGACVHAWVHACVHVYASADAAGTGGCAVFLRRNGESRSSCPRMYVCARACVHARVRVHVRGVHGGVFAWKALFVGAASFKNPAPSADASAPKISLATTAMMGLQKPLSPQGVTKRKSCSNCETQSRVPTTLCPRKVVLALSGGGGKRSEPCARAQANAP